MDVELREALTQGFGPEPAHRPVSDRVEAGHRAVGRRRIAGAVVTLAVASVVGIGSVAVLGGDGDAGSQVATDPTPDPTTDPAAEPTTDPGVEWGEGELARYNNAGILEVRPGVTVLRQVDSPFPASAGMDRSVALDVEQDGEEYWLLLTWTEKVNGSATSGAGAQPGGSAGTFEAWWAEQVELQMTPRPEDNSAGYVQLDGRGGLTSSHGVAILEQRANPELKDFTSLGLPSAAALLQGPDGKKWYVLVRSFSGVEDVDVIATPFRTGGPDLDAFLDYAREKYASGEGLR